MTERIATLDFIRGAAVMGILVANLPAFGLPEAAYFSPAAWGGTTPADITAWAITFVFVEGKMRGLFSFLFGASMLLVIDRARAQGERAATVHFSRMAWLFVIGCLHLYLLWWGDILAHYALVGCAAFLFVRLPSRWLVLLGVAMIGWQALSGVGLALQAFAAHAQDTPAAIETWRWLSASFGTPPGADLAAEIAANRGGLAGQLAWRWTHAIDPFTYVLFGGPETLGYMLFGMAGLRSGFLTGAWPRARYRLIAAAGFAVTIPLYALLAWNSWRYGFDLRFIVLASMAAATPIRPLMILAYASLLVLLLRPAGWLSARVAAAGRVAFTNYLGTSAIMALVFGGDGAALFGQLGRAELYLLVPPVWLAMLAWSTPWLARYRYGPLEWLWRSLAQFEWQPMRRCEPSAKELAS